MVSGGLDPIPLDVSIDTRLLLFTIAVTIATALIFGTVPAFRATRLQLTDTLKAGRGPQGTSGKNPLAKALVISQVALSLVLMVGAGLFLRSLVNLNNVDTGLQQRERPTAQHRFKLRRLQGRGAASGGTRSRKSKIASAHCQT